MLALYDCCSASCEPVQIRWATSSARSPMLNSWVSKTFNFARKNHLRLEAIVFCEVEQKLRRSSHDLRN